MLWVCLFVCFLISEIKDKAEAGLFNYTSRDCWAERYTENIANTQTMSPSEYFLDWNLLGVLLHEWLIFQWFSN